MELVTMSDDVDQKFGRRLMVELEETQCRNLIRSNSKKILDVFCSRVVILHRALEPVFYTLPLLLLREKKRFVEKDKVFE